MDSRQSAHIQMLAREAGGLNEPLETPTRHLLLVFDSDGERLEIGALIHTPSNTPLEPGSHYEVDLSFWAPGSEELLHGRSDFELWGGPCRR